MRWPGDDSGSRSVLCSSKKACLCSIMGAVKVFICDRD